MSNRAWLRRRTKQGLAARQYAAVQRQMRRAKGQPLPQTFTSRGSGLLLTVTLSPEVPAVCPDCDRWHDETFACPGRPV